MSYEGAGLLVAVEYFLQCCLIHFQVKISSRHFLQSLKIYAAAIYTISKDMKQWKKKRELHIKQTVINVRHVRTKCNIDSCLLFFIEKNGFSTLGTGIILKRTRKFVHKMTNFECEHTTILRQLSFAVHGIHTAFSITLSKVLKITFRTSNHSWKCLPTAVSRLHYYYFPCNASVASITRRFIDRKSNKAV